MKNFVSYWTLFLLALLLTGCVQVTASPPPVAPPPTSEAAPTITPSPILTPTDPPAAKPTLVSQPSPTLSPVPTTALLESGIEGRVELNGTCGNQPVIGGEDSCASRPLQVQLTILNQQGAVVAQGTSDRAGDFRFPLPPGAYRLEPESSQFLRANPVEVQVEAGTFSYVPLLYHTLIQ